MLKLFGEATDLTRGEKIEKVEKVVTIGAVLSFHHHLEKLKPQVCLLSAILRSLQTSLNKRFLGLFINVKCPGHKMQTQSTVVGGAPCAG